GSRRMIRDPDGSILNHWLSIAQSQPATYSNTLPPASRKARLIMPILVNWPTSISCCSTSSRSFRAAASGFANGRSWTNFMASVLWRGRNGSSSWLLVVHNLGTLICSLHSLENISKIMLLLAALTAFDLG